MIEFLSSNIASLRNDMGTMIKPRGTQAVVGGQAIGDNDCSRFDIFLHKGLNAVSVSRGHAPKSNPSEFGAISFDRHKNQRFPSSPSASYAFFLPSNVRFVHFHTSAKPLTSATDHDAPQLLQPCPCRLVTSETIGVAQIPRAQAGLLRHHQPHDMKPQEQRFARILKDSPNSKVTEA